MKFSLPSALAAPIAGLAWVASPAVSDAASEPLYGAEYYRLYQSIISIQTADELLDRIDDVERLWEASPDNQRVLRFLAYANVRAGRRQDAIRRYLDLRRTGTFGNADTAHRLARLYAEEDDRPRSLQWIDNALKERISLQRLREDEAFESFRDDPGFRTRLGLVNPDTVSRVDQWRYDLEFLRSEAHRSRFGYDEPSVPAEFDGSLDSLIQRLNGLSDNDIWLEMRRIVAGITDGHSFVGGPARDTDRAFDTRTLPVSFFDFDDGLFVAAAEPEYAELVGGQIVQLGDLDRDALMAALDPYVQADNTRTVRYIGAQLLLRRTVFLRAIGVTDQSGKVLAKINMPDGRTLEATLPSGDFEVQRRLSVPPHLDNPPTYQSRLSDNYWATSLGEKAQYIQINRFRDADDGLSLSEFSDDLWSRLGKVHSVVVDLRHNNGGNERLSVPVMKTLLAFERLAPQNQVFVVTGHMTFSAAQIFISRLDAFGSPIFVGTPSAASPNFTGEEDPISLPYSGLAVSFSSLYWQNSTPLDHREWIEVVVPVPWRGRDYVAGRDAALEAILAIINDEGIEK